MMVYCVKVYVNKNITDLSFFNDLQGAMNYANAVEDRDFICEIECYEYHKHISREFWRNAKFEVKS